MVVACTPGRVKEQLARADATMQSAPDSALAILDSIDPSELRSSQYRALYALLLTQARDKNNVVVTDDSLINIALEYYSDSSDDERAMWAYFYKGRVLYNSGLYPEAAPYILRGLEYAKNIGEPFAIGKNYDMLADIYSANGNRKEDIENRTLAYEYYSKTDRDNFTNYCMFELTIAYSHNNQGDKALAYLDTLEQRASKTDSVFLANLYFGKAYACLCKKDYLNAYKNTQKQLLYRNGDEYGKGRNLYIAEIYLNIGKLDSAAYFENKEFKRYPSIKNSVLHLLHLSNRAKILGDKDADIKYSDKIISMLDSTYKSILQNSVAIAERNYYIKESEAKKHEAKTIRLVSLIIFGFTLILAIGFFLYIRQYRRRKNAELDAAVAQMQNLLAEIGSSKIKSEETHSIQQKCIDTLLRARFSDIDALVNKYFKLKEEGKKGLDGIIDDLNRIVAKINTPKNLETLQQIINENYDNIIEKFKIQIPRVNEAQTTLFTYLITGLSARTICLLCSVTTANYYNKLSRLRQKIEKSDAPDKELFLQMMKKD